MGGPATIKGPQGGQGNSVFGQCCVLFWHSVQGGGGQVPSKLAGQGGGCSTQNGCSCCSVGRRWDGLPVHRLRELTWRADQADVGGRGDVARARAAAAAAGDALLPCERAVMQANNSALGARPLGATMTL